MLRRRARRRSRGDAATIEANKLKVLKSLCAAEAQAAALHLEQAAKECAPKNFRGATATVLAPADSDELRAAFESLQLAMLPLRNDVQPAIGLETVGLFGSPS